MLHILLWILGIGLFAFVCAALFAVWVIGQAFGFVAEVLLYFLLMLAGGYVALVAVLILIIGMQGGFDS